MISGPNEARGSILSRLRHALVGSRPIFREAAKPPPAVPAVPAPVTHAEGDARALAALFGSRLEELHGSYEMVEKATDVADRAAARIRAWLLEDDVLPATEGPDPLTAEVLAWAAREIPVDRLDEQLKRAGISLYEPPNLHDEACRAQAARLTVGVTSVDAAFASTGSFVVASGRRKSRAASLLPLHHLVLIPLSRLYPTLESWLAALRTQERLGSFLRASSQVAFVTGPSKSADIELQLTLGVHGPRDVHAILFGNEKNSAP